jgi:toxin ParE1/3/4
MARVVLTDAADADAAFIFDDLYAKAGKPTVVKYRAAFKTLYERLADFPDSGAPRPTIGAQIRIGIVSPYIVIYKHTEADSIVRVLRIVHGSRRITRRLLRGV